MRRWFQDSLGNKGFKYMYSSKLECFGCGVYAIVVFGDDHVTGHTGVDDISSDVAEA